MEARDISGKEKEISSDELKKAFLQGVPFAYLLGEADFYHRKYFINQNVLIPRQETEYLVDLIVREEKGKRQRILDVGTGSGVILSSLLLNSVVINGVGVDLSENALEVAQTNITTLGLSYCAQLIKSDRLENVEGKFDLIVSNPPYIKTHAHQLLVHSKVDEYEPHEALYILDQIYDQWFERFFLDVRSHLSGVFYMEGHELEVNAQANKLEKLGFTDVTVMNDLAGSPRFIRGIYRP
jgi:release factor glutamine methyltransferase